MPIDLFWMLYRRSGELEAEEALRDIQTMASAFHGGENSQKHIEQLKEIAGRPIVIEEKLDRKGIEELRRLQALM